MVDRADDFARSAAELLLEVLAVGPGGKAHDFIQGAGYDGILRADGALGVEGGDRGEGDARQKYEQRPAHAKA